MNRLLKLFALASFSVAAILAQGDVAQLNGTVTDPHGAAVPNAHIVVLNVDTGQSTATNANEHGEWLLPGMQAATYRVTVSAPGFSNSVLDGAVMHAGVPLTVNAKLEIGSVSETVSVSAAAEQLQTTNATVSSTVQTKQVTDLPYISRGGMDLFVTQPSVQTTGANRNSTINGLPLAALNVTLDGINVQTNTSKDTDGFFALIPVRQDSLEEITLTTSASGADANAQGAATVRFVTKSGTNQYHGGVFWQHRNTDLNANSYFNNINGLPRNREIINQPGVNLGGPIIKNKLLFFTDLEFFRYPATGSVSRVVMNPSDVAGNYYYPVAGSSTPRSVNVLALAAAAGFPSTADPIISKTLNQIQSYVPNGTLQDRIASNSDYNRSNLLFSPKGYSNSWTDTSRLDYNINTKNTLSLVYTYYVLSGKDDVTNGVWNTFPGTGAIVGQDDLYVNQSGNRYALSASLRTVFTPSVVNSLRFGLNRGLSLFRPQVSSASQFSEWRGYAPSMGFSLANVYAVNGSVRYQSPVRELHDNLSWQKGSHFFTFGGDVSQINQWYETIGTSVIPTVTFGAATNDPVVTGSTNLFTSTTMPGSTATYQSDAAALYALLTGRVSQINRSVAYNGQNYGSIPQIDKSQQYEYGFFAQDSWRVLPSLTLTLGLRFEVQQPYQETQQAYSYVSYAAAWGISGVGNLFNPNASGGTAPTYNKYNPNYYSTPSRWAPSIGLAWQLPSMSGPLGLLLGRRSGTSVLRAGYNIATVRDAGQFMTAGDTNQGLTLDTTVSPGNAYASDFGAAGSVLFSQPNLPAHTAPSTPQYPISPTMSNSLYVYDPHLKIPYVQSWNIGFQRQLSKNLVMEVRYTGNHGVDLWRTINLNEINTFENGFQSQFYQAQENLFVNRGCTGNPTSPLAWNTCTNPNSNSFANAGLAGQGAVPIFSTALGTTTDSTTATALRQNTPGTIARTYATNTTDYGRLVAAGYRPNFFQVNPNVTNANLITNGGLSTYNALQVEVNRRLATGLLMQGSYVWAKNLGESGQPTTLRNWGLDKDPVNNDLRNAFKLNGLYQLPVGIGHRFMSSNRILDRIFGGWEISGISRVQSGAAFQLTSGRTGVNQNEAGVVLMNMTLPQLQSMVNIQKITPAVTTAGQTPVGQVQYLPTSLITNTNAAFETNGQSWATLNANAPYISPQLAQGQLGYEVFLRNPWQYHLDAAILKRTTIKERFKTEFQVNFDNVLNLTNFLVANGPSTTSFGRTTSAYNDLAYNYDPGSRVIEIRLRVSF
ncbi:MAG TPA: TonB-dependent receptor [Bryobacteraceae bacterium]|nr:TonB-dependent receptor [Bryobacteraceae bacterium]